MNADQSSESVFASLLSLANELEIAGNKWPSIEEVQFVGDKLILALRCERLIWNAHEYRALGAATAIVDEITLNRGRQSFEDDAVLQDLLDGVGLPSWPESTARGTKPLARKFCQLVGYLGVSTDEYPPNLLVIEPGLVRRLSSIVFESIGQLQGYDSEEHFYRSSIGEIHAKYQVACQTLAGLIEAHAMTLAPTIADSAFVIDGETSRIQPTNRAPSLKKNSYGKPRHRPAKADEERLSNSELYVIDLWKSFWQKEEKAEGKFQPIDQEAFDWFEKSIRPSFRTVYGWIDCILLNDSQAHARASAKGRKGDKCKWRAGDAENVIRAFEARAKQPRPTPVDLSDV